MKTKEWRDIDKSKWGPGPWQEEPDKVQWLDVDAGFPCMAQRNHAYGSWCGYVGVSKGHPAYEVPYDDCAVDVHGGLTFSGHCDGRICHEVEAGEDDNVFWLGFDCAHSMDRMPAIESLLERIPGSLRTDLYWMKNVYRTLEFVKAECSMLAKQLKEKRNFECGVKR